MTVPADDPRDALAQRLHDIISPSEGHRHGDDCGGLSPGGADYERAAAILADGSRYLSPAQAAEQDRLRDAAYRLTHSTGSGAYVRAFDDLRDAVDALDEPVTGEPTDG